MAERQSALPPKRQWRSANVALQNVNDSKHWRDRAAEMRVLSCDMKDPEAQSMMFKLANDYDKLADRAEDRAARDETPGPSPMPEAR